MTEPMIISYLGITLDGWKELQKYRDECKGHIPLFDSLVENNARLRGKLSFYEAHIAAMAIVKRG